MSVLLDEGLGQRLLDAELPVPGLFAWLDSNPQHSIDSMVLNQRNEFLFSANI